MIQSLCKHAVFCNSPSKMSSRSHGGQNSPSETSSALHVHAHTLSGLLSIVRWGESHKWSVFCSESGCGLWCAQVLASTLLFYTVWCPLLLLALHRTLAQKAEHRGVGLKLQLLFGSPMDVFLAGQLMASGYWSLGSNSCLVSFD